MQCAEDFGNCYKCTLGPSAGPLHCLSKITVPSGDTYYLRIVTRPDHYILSRLNIVVITARISSARESTAVCHEPFYWEKSSDLNCRPERIQLCGYHPSRGEGHSAHTSLTKHSSFLKLPSDKMPVHALCGVALITGAATGQL